MLDQALTTPLGVLGRRQLLLTTFNQQSGRCYYCKLEIYKDLYTQGATKKSLATIEHLVPQSLGGCSCAVNLVVVCQQCNSMRGKIPIPIFLRLLAKVFENPSLFAAWHKDSREARTMLKKVGRAFGKASRSRVPPTLIWPSSPR